ncbi:MAG: hypothetical protein ACLFQV_10525 [Vulcanimicrobiota bacterium]
MKRILFILILVLISIAFIPGRVLAKEDKTGNFNFNETTGIVNMPTARTIEYKTLNFAIRMAKLGKNPPLKHKWQTPTPGPFSGTPFDSDWWIDNDGDRRLLISPIRNVEFSFMNYHSQRLTPTLGAKWVVLPEKKSFPAIAIGANNILGDPEDATYSQEVIDANSKIAPYIVASKRLGQNDMFDLSVGIGGGRFRRRVFYGGEVSLDKKHLLRAVGEYDGNVYSYGFKYTLPRGRWNFGLFLQDRDQPGFTFSYTMPW